MTLSPNSRAIVTIGELTHGPHKLPGAWIKHEYGAAWLPLSALTPVPAPLPGEYMVPAHPTPGCPHPASYDAGLCCGKWPCTLDLHADGDDTAAEAVDAADEDARIKRGIAEAVLATVLRWTPKTLASADGSLPLFVAANSYRVFLGVEPVSLPSPDPSTPERAPVSETFTPPSDQSPAEQVRLALLYAQDALEHYGEGSFGLGIIANAVGHASAPAAPDLSALERAVVEEFGKAEDTASAICGDRCWGPVWRPAVDALNALRAASAPKPPVDPVEELRAAAAAMVKRMGYAIGEHAETDRLRTALAALGEGKK